MENTDIEEQGKLLRGRTGDSVVVRKERADLRKPRMPPKAMSRCLVL